MASYAEHVSDNLQHASELLEIDRKISQDKFIQQENILALKQKEIEEIIKTNKEKENNLSVLRKKDNYDEYYSNNNYENDDSVNNHNNLRGPSSSQKNPKKFSENSYQNTVPNKSAFGTRQNEVEITVEKKLESYDDRQMSEDEDNDNDNDDYSIAFDLDNSRLSMSERYDESMIDVEKRRGERGGRERRGEKGGRKEIDVEKDRTNKSSRRTSFCASISSEGLPSSYITPTSVSTSQKKKKRGSTFLKEAPGDSDYSEAFESIDYEDEMDEKEIEEVDESAYHSINSNYSNRKAKNMSISKSQSQSQSLSESFEIGQKEKKTMKNILTSFEKDQKKIQNKANIKAAASALPSSVDISTATYSTDSYDSTDDPDLESSSRINSTSASASASASAKKKNKGGNQINGSNKLRNVSVSPTWSRNIPQPRALSPQEAEFVLVNRRQHGTPGRFQTAGPRSPLRDRTVSG